MVYVNSKKFACESCIKGHRSSSCHHTDRPLFEIKKKGRPVSQCEKCRELRQSKRVHSKCTCTPKEGEVAQTRPVASSSTSKSRRFVPITPALPNGLKDVLQASQISFSLQADTRQRVDSLLNPCDCKSVWKCKCRITNAAGPSNNSQNAKGLATLAHAAAMHCNAEQLDRPGPSSRNFPISNTAEDKLKRQTSRPGSPTYASHKRAKLSNPEQPHAAKGLDLPPIYLTTDSSAPLLNAKSLPTFAVMPPMSTISSLAGSGCTCGLQCACPGCVEHRGPEHASADHRNCADGCGTCIDRQAGITLPGMGGGSSATDSILNRFFARAAALPAPPSNRRMGVGVQLDPMNVMVYPETARETEQHGAAFGLVSLPKLECCGGQCGCPNGRCGCGKACDGCCADHGGDVAAKESPTVDDRRSPVVTAPSPPPVLRSCCAGKAAAVGA